MDYRRKSQSHLRMRSWRCAWIMPMIIQKTLQHWKAARNHRLCSEHCKSQHWLVSTERMRWFPGLSRTSGREDFSWRKLWALVVGPPCTSSPCYFFALEMHGNGVSRVRQADINSLTCERKVFLTHTSYLVRCANNKQQQVYSPEATLEMGWVAQRSVGGSRKAVATHGHEAPAVKWCSVIRELIVGWHRVKLLGTQQPAPSVVYSTIRAAARRNAQCRAQKPALNTAHCPFLSGQRSVHTQHCCPGASPHTSPVGTAHHCHHCTLAGPQMKQKSQTYFCWSSPVEGHRVQSGPGSWWRVCQWYLGDEHLAKGVSWVCWFIVYKELLNIMILWCLHNR